MTKKHILFGVIGLIGLFVVIIGISLGVNFNRAVRNRNATLEKKALIAVAIEARFDKLEELLNALTGLEEHVETQLEKITEARAAFANSNADEMADDYDEIQTGFSNIRVIIEADPGVYIATSAYNSYMAEISATINMITSAKIQYNNAVTEFNNNFETFPRNLYLKLFGFEKLPLYEPTT